MQRIENGKMRETDTWCPYLMFGDRHTTSCGAATGVLRPIESRCATENFDNCTVFLARLLMREGRAA